MQQYLDRHRFLKGIYLMVRRYFDHHVGRDSAALTYYLLFALFPLLIFLSNLVGIMSVDISGFLYEIRAFIPQEALEIIEQYFTYVSRDSSPRLLWFSHALQSSHCASSASQVRILSTISTSKST